MSGWLGGMSGNLVADLLTVVILYVIGRRFLDRNVANGIYVRSSPIVVSASHGRTPDYEVEVILGNHSSESIFDVHMSLGNQKPYDDSGGLRQDFVFPPGNDNEFMEILQPGQTVRLDAIPLEHAEGDFLLLNFSTTRGRRYVRVFPVSTTAGWKQKPASLGLRLRVWVWRVNNVT